MLFVFLNRNFLKASRYIVNDLYHQFFKDLNIKNELELAEFFREPLGTLGVT